jgi:hypothetical protein
VNRFEYVIRSIYSSDPCGTVTDRPAWTALKVAAYLDTTEANTLTGNPFKDAIDLLAGALGTNHPAYHDVFSTLEDRRSKLASQQIELARTGG